MQVLGLCFSDSVAGVTGRHDPTLVAVAFAAATFAAFTALTVVERLRRAAPRLQPVWLAVAALVLGGGVWSMHFIATLAYKAPLTITFDAVTTLLSGAIAVAGVACGLSILGQGGAPRILGGGVLVGLSIAVMHYLGISALRTPGEIYYRPALFGLSVAIAVLASTVALWLAVHLRTATQRAVAALAMAAAICGMHFTGMAAMAIAPAGPLAAPGAGGLAPSPLLVIAIVLCLVVTLAVALICADFDRRLEVRAASEAERLRAMNESLEEKVRRRTVELTQALLALDDQRQVAETASRSKSDFLANMSHELRTPLNAVIGFAELLQYQGDDLKPNQFSALEHIVTAGRHLLALIEDILDFAKIEAGKVNVALRAIEPASLLSDLAATFRFDLERADVSLRLDAPDEALAVRADSVRLKQVLTNLISNAIKYNRPGGQVVVSVTALVGQVAVSVRDTGLGIPAERLADLFEPFNRLGREDLAIEGVGLGLALTKRLVEAMGGELAVDSAPGVGSVFTVRLPAAEPAHRAAAAATRPGARAILRQNLDAVVLYIEDNASNIQLMQDVADAVSGFELHVAERPEDGLKAATRLRPDLILLDINLPGMNGFEVKARLDSNILTATIPVVALSANVLSETITRSLAAGFHSYLTKPLSIPQLLETIAQAVAETRRSRVSALAPPAEPGAATDRPRLATA